SILSQLAREGRISVVEDLKVDAPKTKLFAQKVKALGFGDNGSSVLFVTDQLDDNVFLSSRNLPHVLVLETRHVDPVRLVGFQNGVLTRGALAQFEEMLA